MARLKGLAAFSAKGRRKAERVRAREQSLAKFAEKNPKLGARLAEIRKKAAKFQEPEYELKDYLPEIYELAFKWKKSGVLDQKLRSLADACLVKYETKNPLSALVRATSVAGLDRRKVSKYAKELQRALQKNLDPLEFFIARN